MRNKTNAFFVFGCLVLVSTTWCANKNEQATSPEALLSRARQQQDIWSGGAPPILMRAEVQVIDFKGALVSGDYTLNWVSTSRWREEMGFANYVRLRVGNPGGYWQKSPLSYQPEPIFQLDTLLHVKEVLRVRSKQTLGKVRSREKSGEHQECTEVKWAMGTERILCFDDASGRLVRVEYPKGEQSTPPEISRIEYSEFHAVSGKLVPYEIRAWKGKKLVAAVKVVEIATATEQNPTLFNPPENAEFWANCDDMKEAELTTRVVPNYPTSAKLKYEQGRVIFYAVIEADGSVSHLTIIQRATPDLEAAAAAAVRQWRYKPPTCGQTSVRIETTIAVDFWLGR